MTPFMPLVSDDVSFKDGNVLLLFLLLSSSNACLFLAGVFIVIAETSAELDCNSCSRWRVV